MPVQADKREQNVAGRFFLGTFHKTGTVLWKHILLAARNRGVLDFCDLNDEPFRADACMFFNHHAHWISDAMQGNGCAVNQSDKWLICIRDPRDMIVSSAFYHTHTEESWCHIPRPEFGGLTYQEKLNSYQALDDRFLFEMEHSAGRNIRAMEALHSELAFSKAKFVKLEDLMVDWYLRTFRECFEFLELSPKGMVDMLAIAVERSLFAETKHSSTVAHARSGSIAEFSVHFSDRVHERFDRAFPSSLERLGYPREGLVDLMAREQLIQSNGH